MGSSKSLLGSGCGSWETVADWHACGTPEWKMKRLLRKFPLVLEVRCGYHTRRPKGSAALLCQGNTYTVLGPRSSVVFPFIFWEVVCGSEVDLALR